MPRYFFDVHDGSSSLDNEGTELPDLNAARVQAVGLAGALLKDNAEQFWNGEQWEIHVRDERGLILFTLGFLATEAPILGGLKPWPSPPPPILKTSQGA